MKNILYCFVIVLVLTILKPVSVLAQENWEERHPPNHPSARSRFAMAYDSDRGVIVLHGGESGNDTTYSDTWEYDGKNWTLIQNANGPVRHGHQMEYDPVGHYMIMVGGVNQQSGELAGNRNTYKYQNQQWICVGQTSSPGVSYHSMVWDSGEQRIYLHAWKNGDDDFVPQVYYWNRNTGSWYNSPYETPSYKVDAFYDPYYYIANRGTGFQIVGKSVLEIPGGVQNQSGAASGGEYSATYFDYPDPDKRKGLMFGGNESQVGVALSQRTHQVKGVPGYGVFVITELFPATQPAKRRFHRMVYMENIKKVVMFGGEVWNGDRLSDTWHYGVTTDEVPQFRIRTSASAGGTITPLGDYWAVAGEDKQFYFSAEPGYVVSSFKIDGISFQAPANGIHTLINIQNHHTIDIGFTLATYTISGKVIDGSGQGVQGVTIGGLPGTPITDANGDYSTVVTAGYSGTAVPSKSGLTFSPASTTYSSVSSNLVNQNFTAYQNLTVTGSGSGQGNVSSDPAGISISYNGTVTTGTTTASFPLNSAITLQTTSPEGYQFVGWSGGIQSGQEHQNPLTISVNESKNIVATFENKTYSLNATSDSNGSISGESTQTINHGSNSTTITAVPNEGYRFVSWSNNGTRDQTVQDPSIRFTNVISNITATASFELKSYTLTATSGAGGSVSPASATVSHGGNQTFIIDPDENYGISACTDNGTDKLSSLVDKGNGTWEYTIESIFEDHSISVTFARNIYIITVTSGEHGSFTPSSPIHVNKNEDQLLTITPEDHYKVSSFTIDGDDNLGNLVDAGGGNWTYNFEDISQDHSVSVDYGLNEYTVTVNADSNSKVRRTSGDTSLADQLVFSVVKGQASPAFELVPNEGYGFIEWSDESKTNPRTVENVTQDQTISATTGTQVRFTVTTQIANSGNYLKYLDPENGGHIDGDLIIGAENGTVTVHYDDQLDGRWRSSGFNIEEGSCHLTVDRASRTVTVSGVNEAVVVRAELIGVEQLVSSGDSGFSHSLEVTIVETNENETERPVNWLTWFYTDENSTNNVQNKGIFTYRPDLSEKILLANDENNSWPRAPVGSVEVLQNSQIFIDMSLSEKTANGIRKTLKVPVYFKTWNDLPTNCFIYINSVDSVSNIRTEKEDVLDFTPQFSAVSVDFALSDQTDLTAVDSTEQANMLNDLRNRGEFTVELDSNPVNLIKQTTGSDWELRGQTGIGTGIYYFARSSLSYSFTQDQFDTNAWSSFDGEQVLQMMLTGKNHNLTFEGQPLGEIAIYLNPSLWRDDGAQWAQARIGSSVSQWYTSGHTEVSPIGKNRIKIKAIPGWHSIDQFADYDSGSNPDIIDSELLVRWNTSSVATINMADNHLGTITVFIEPNKVQGAPWNATWSFRNSTHKFASGTTRNNVAVGYQKIEFNSDNANGAAPPGIMTVPIRPLQPEVVTGTYTVFRNEIFGRIQPIAAAQAGGMWRWRATIPAGNHSAWYGPDVVRSMNGVAVFNVSFKAIAGWSTPGVLSFWNSSNNLRHFVTSHFYTKLSSTSNEMSDTSDTESGSEQFAVYTRILASRNIPLDFNGDGKQDVGFYRPSNQTWYIKGLGSVKFGSDGAIPAPGDYDGDGKTEIVYFDCNTGYWHSYRGKAYKFGNPDDVPVSGDFDGDGITDPAVYRGSTSKVYCRLSSLKNTVSTMTVSGFPYSGDFASQGKDQLIHQSLDQKSWMINKNRVANIETPDNFVPAIADYDGDGQTELALFDVETAIWSDVGGKFRIPFGEPGDVPVPADYNNDGKADLAVFRPTTGEWFVRGISNSVFTGLPGDVPLVSGN